MTTKTKAHGYIYADWRDGMAEGEYEEALPPIWTQDDGNGRAPICLISPATCDKVREFVEAMRKRDLNQSEIYYAAELLKLLPGVE